MLFSALSITAVDSTGFRTAALQKIKTDKSKKQTFIKPNNNKTAGHSVWQRLLIPHWITAHQWMELKEAEKE